MNKQIFCRLTKYDEKTHIAEGVITSETVDKANEALDYDGSKPYFEAWSSEFSKATDGQSVGNLRAMHGKTVAGKFIKVEFDDAAKVIRASAEVVDTNEQVKCAKGCYTGFSIGGSYVKQVPHPTLDGVTAYIAKPTEVSLVDNPCNPDATFTYAKSDGSTELRKYAPPEAETAQDVTITISALDTETVRKALAELPADHPLRKTLAKVAERSDTSPKEGESEYGNVTFADATNKKYPIDTPAHIRAAWNYINKAKNAGKYSPEDAKAIKSKIVAAWKEHIDPKGPPSAEKVLEPADMAKAAALDCIASVLVEKSAKDAKVAGQLSKLGAFVGAPLEKGFWSVAGLAEIIARLQGCMQEAEWEESYEQDGSTIPAQLSEAGASLCHILLAMAEEECDEAFKHGYEEDDGETMKAVTAGRLTKFAELHKTQGPALEKRAVEAEAKVGELEKGALAKDERIKVLEKDVTDGHALMQKAADTIDEQKRVLTKIMAEPSAKKPAMFALGKADDVLPVPGQEVEEKPIFKADGTKDEVRMALRKQLQTPIAPR
ncbi:MAG: DUF6582 domain-containing protein [Chloroflexota bacterium]